MSLEHTRAAIVAAFNAGMSPDVARCFPRYRQTVRTGDAWPRLAQRTRASNGFGYVDTWEVWVVLPQQLDQAEQWLDDHLDELLVALTLDENGDRLFFNGVTTVTPAELALGSIAVNGVILQGAREG